MNWRFPMERRKCSRNALANTKNWLRPAGRPRASAADFRLIGQKMSWLWGNPYKILAENRPFAEMSWIYEQVRTNFERNTLD